MRILSISVFPTFSRFVVLGAFKQNHMNEFETFEISIEILFLIPVSHLLMQIFLVMLALFAILNPNAQKLYFRNFFQKKTLFFATYL